LGDVGSAGVAGHAKNAARREAVPLQTHTHPAELEIWRCAVSGSASVGHLSRRRLLIALLDTNRASGECDRPRPDKRRLKLVMHGGLATFARSAVLVASTESGLADALQQPLADRECNVEVASTWDHVVDATEQGAPDLILLAFSEPLSTIATRCVEIRRRCAAPILIATDETDPAAIAAVYETPAVDVVPTEVPAPILVNRVAQLLRTSRCETDLRESCESLDRLQRIANVGSWSLDAGSEEMHWSEQMHQILGFDDSVAKTDFEGFSLCVHPEDRESIRMLIDDVLQEKRDFSAPLRVVLSSGAVRHVQMRGEISPDLETRAQGTIQDITEQRRAQERIRFLAHYDSLTGLANRRRFIEQLDKSMQLARRERHPMALLYMDLDQFKRINDTLGHTTGDELLQGVAQTLFDQVRSTDVIGRPSGDFDSEISRLGGDEFAILLTAMSSTDDAGLVAGRILEALPTPIVVDQHSISTTASIGIAIYPDDGDDVDTLVKHADRAMYHAKERGRNNFQFFHESMNAGAMRRLTLESRLHSALEAGETRMVYQPRIDLASGAVIGVEALMRWNHPELGAVSPKEFIPIAEESGLITELGQWALEQACERCVAWGEAGLAGLDVSVNVSTRQFGPQNLIGRVADALRNSGLDPNRLELEITENVLLRDDEATARVLRDLRAMGVRIALDDFGTGYSSLSYLARFPLDTLKLDRSLVRDLTTSPSARGVATAVISMAHALDLRVVGEGVDEAEQARFLTDHGCDEIQGFLIAGPMEPDVLAAFVEEHMRSAESPASS
jgi:diguanylate cyclase (GGDEF)-like protein/PAS domain S-box-containing protein